MKEVEDKLQIYFEDISPGVDFTNIFRARFSQNITRKETYVWKTRAKTLVKSTPGVNFTNFLQAAFTQPDPKSANKHWWLDCL